MTANKLTATERSIAKPLTTAQTRKTKKNAIAVPQIESDIQHKEVQFTLSFVDEFPADGDSCPTQPYLVSKDDEAAHEFGKLNEEDRKFFKELEEDLDDGWDIFVATGFALAAIKDNGYYRETHPTFSAYCKDKLKMKHIDSLEAAIETEQLGKL